MIALQVFMVLVLKVNVCVNQDITDQIAPVKIALVDVMDMAHVMIKLVNVLVVMHSLV